jgi:hypothetical protein
VDYVGLVLAEFALRFCSAELVSLWVVGLPAHEPSFVD